MLRDFIWKTFENTGNIDAYLLYKEIEKVSVNEKKNNKNQAADAVHVKV